MVQITPNAVKEFQRIKLNRQKPDTSLRIRVKSGGCSGLFYDLQLEAEDGKNPSGDRLLKIDDISIVVDSLSWEYVENLQLDYSEDLMGGSFRFHNPKAKNICSCGISFKELEAV